jgi:hypothetical protein
MKRLIAAFITGHSVRGCTGLSREQIDFQKRSAIPQEQWLPHNFPYSETHPFPEPVPLLAASLSNIVHFWESRLPAYKNRHRDAVAGIFSGHDAVILVAGSCGLELLNNLGLPAEVLRRLHVFACGPVSWRLPETASCLVLQGAGDPVSRCFHRKADHWIDCAHMGYLQSPETMRLFNDLYFRVLRDLRSDQ